MTEKKIFAHFQPLNTMMTTLTRNTFKVPVFIINNADNGEETVQGATNLPVLENTSIGEIEISIDKELK